MMEKIGPRKPELRSKEMDRSVPRTRSISSRSQIQEPCPEYQPTGLSGDEEMRPKLCQATRRKKRSHRKPLERTRVVVSD